MATEGGDEIAEELAERAAQDEAEADALGRAKPPDPPDGGGGGGGDPPGGGSWYSKAENVSANIKYGQAALKMVGLGAGGYGALRFVEGQLGGLIHDAEDGLGDLVHQGEGGLSQAWQGAGGIIDGLTGGVSSMAAGPVGTALELILVAGVGYGAWRLAHKV